MNNPEKKKGCGCIAKGCVVMVILAGILIGVLVWGGKKLVAWTRAHASSSPVAVSVENGTRDEYEALIKRLDDFKSAAPGAGKTLELNAHDLNLLIKFSPEWNYVRGKIQASIENDKIGLTGSLPLDFVPSLAGMYWNGEMHFTLSLDDKTFHFSVLDAQVEGGELSSEGLKTFSTIWTVYLTSYQLPVIGPVLANAKTLAVKDGVIALTSK